MTQLMTLYVILLMQLTSEKSCMYMHSWTEWLLIDGGGRRTVI